MKLQEAVITLVESGRSYANPYDAPPTFPRYAKDVIGSNDNNVSIERSSFGTIVTGSNGAGIAFRKENGHFLPTLFVPNSL